MSFICKSKFQDLGFIIPEKDTIDKILKTIIFVDKIDNTISIAKYLQL